LRSKAKQSAETYRLQLLERTSELDRVRIQLTHQTRLLEKQNAELRILSARLLTAQDDERRRIARELHDGLGQGLVLLSFDLAKVRAMAADVSPVLARAIAEKIEDCRSLAEEVRTISYLLHPPLLDEMGLIPALKCYVEGFQQRSNITVDLQLPSEKKRLPEDLETTIFRVAQECLSNVYRHSGSATACVRLSWQPDGSISLIVSDRGKGISAQKLKQIANQASGVGLRGIAERLKLHNGLVKIVVDRRGTSVRTFIPAV
jgi:signal transduction histidine kinase